MTKSTLNRSNVLATVVGALMLGTCAAASATVVNGSFETALTGWTSSGTTGTNATATAGGSSALIVAVDGGPGNASAIETFTGASDASLRAIKSGYTDFTTGSAIQQTFTAAAGSTLSFDFRTLTNENIISPWDFTFFVLDGVATALGDTNINSGFGAGVAGYANANSWSTFTQTIGSSGSHTLSFGAMQARDNSVATALLVDNVEVSGTVPEPGSIALLGLGAFGFAAASRKRGKKQDQA